MNEVIAYQIAGQPVSIVIPGKCGLSTHQIGVKDVPPGIPFWILPSDSIPSDRTMRDAWELDTESMGSPDGVGGAA